jgi:hypothetical protein
MACSRREGRPCWRTFEAQARIDARAESRALTCMGGLERTAAHATANDQRGVVPELLLAGIRAAGHDSLAAG